MTESNTSATHIGILEKSGTTETPDGEKIYLKTDQGEFVLTCTSLNTVRGLQMSAELYERDIVRGEV